MNYGSAGCEDWCWTSTTPWFPGIKRNSLRRCTRGCRRPSHGECAPASSATRCTVTGCGASPNGWESAAWCEPENLSRRVSPRLSTPRDGPGPHLRHRRSGVHRHAGGQPAGADDDSRNASQPRESPHTRLIRRLERPLRRRWWRAQEQEASGTGPSRRLDVEEVRTYCGSEGRSSGYTAHKSGTREKKEGMERGRGEHLGSRTRRPWENASGEDDVLSPGRFVRRDVGRGAVEFAFGMQVKYPHAHCLRPVSAANTAQAGLQAGRKGIIKGDMLWYNADKPYGVSGTSLSIISSPQVCSSLSA